MWPLRLVVVLIAAGGTGPPHAPAPPGTGRTAEGEGCRVGAPSHGDGRTSERCHLDLGGAPRGDAITGKASVSRWGGLWGGSSALFPSRRVPHGQSGPQKLSTQPSPPAAQRRRGCWRSGRRESGGKERRSAARWVRESGSPPGGRSCVRAKQGGMEFGFRYDSLSTQAEHGSGFSRPMSWGFLLMCGRFLSAFGPQP